MKREEHLLTILVEECAELQKDTAFIVAASVVVGMAMLAALVVPPFVIVSCINALAELGGSGFYT